MKSLPHGFTATRLGTVDGFRLVWHNHGRPLSRGEALITLRDDAAAGKTLGSAPEALGYAGMYWECAVFAPTTRHQEFECVALRADHFAYRTPEPNAFADQFARARQHDQVIYFPSRGGDSRLVAPLPLSNIKAYGHIASFVRLAPPQQISAFFTQLSTQALRRAQTKPVWMSTAGDAIAWLHGRLDTRPKYYRYRPYMAPPLGNDHL